MYNLASLLLGLASWLLGIRAIVKPGIRWLSAASLLACGAALLVQLMEVGRRVGLKDWSALLDTMDAVLTAAFVLLTVTTALNLIALLRSRAMTCNTKRAR